MGSSSSKPNVPEPVSQQSTPATPGDGGGGCPVKHAPASEAGCPVKHQEYNVYSQPIDPKNQMPAVANQLPSPGQKESLSTERVKSTIPKGGADEGTTWTYPSPQMFYNALTRKQKLGTTDESDIPIVVALHNNMNERTWTKVLEWEALANNQKPPKLLKFMGRPLDLSPKARVKHWLLGHPLPFDRHDWTILREDGTTVRYVIDYYHDDTRDSSAEGMPDMHDFDATQSLMVDVRPALDGVSGAIDRLIRMPYARHVAGSTTFEPLPMIPTSEMKSQVQESVQVWDSIQKAARNPPQEEEPPEISDKEATAIATSFDKMMHNCQEAQEKVNACESEQECARASMDLTLCMAKSLCPLQHTAFVNALQQDDSENVEEYNARLDKALDTVSECLAGVSKRARLAKEAHPDAFKDTF